MKNFVVMLVMAGLIALSIPAVAGERTGVYVAPKFVFGIVHLDDMKMDWVDSAPEHNYSSSSKTKSSVGGALAVGYDFSPMFQVPVRAELEYAAFSRVKGGEAHATTAGGDIRWSGRQKMQFQTLFVNAYYDFRNSSCFTPYIGAGLGLAFVDSKADYHGYQFSTGDEDDISASSKTRTNFAWNVGAGVGYDINDVVTVDLGYRFAGLGKAETKKAEGWVSSKTDDIYMHQIMLGLRVNF